MMSPITDSKQLRTYGWQKLCEGAAIVSEAWQKVDAPSPNAYHGVLSQLIL